MLTDPALLATLSRHYLFSSLPVAARRDIASYTCARRLAQGAPVFHQGDTVQHFYILVSGQIKLHRISSDGQETLVEVIRPGDAFAEALLFNGVPHYPLSATALKGSLLLSVQNAPYLRLLAEQPKLCLPLLACLSIRLHQRLNEIDNLTSSNAHHRVVRFLVQEQHAGTGVVDLDVPKRLVASKLGIQPETFSRILQRLIKAGLIAVRRRRIEILDARNLAAHLDEAVY
jgi:CRP-like cAMP-binding protein